MGERANPFGNLDDFGPKSAAARVPEAAQIEQLAESNGFPSRRPVPTAVPPAPPVAQPAARQIRRRTTGRNQQINIKATAHTVSRLYRLADEQDVALGELLELALEAFEQAKAAGGT